MYDSKIDRSNILLKSPVIRNKFCKFQGEIPVCNKPRVVQLSVQVRFIEIHLVSTSGIRKDKEKSTTYLFTISSSTDIINFS